MPQAGDRFLVVDGKGEPVCAVELTAVEMKLTIRSMKRTPLPKARAIARWRKELQRFFEESTICSRRT
ncbi:ASCH domain-containing protein [Serratia ureilytica]